jgi:hypothetical protein
MAPCNCTFLREMCVARDSQLQKVKLARFREDYTGIDSYLDVCNYTNQPLQSHRYSYLELLGTLLLLKKRIE